MNKRHRYGISGSSRARLLALAFLSICFILGLVLGCFLASFFQTDSDNRLFSYLESYFTVLETGGLSDTSLFSTFWELCRWPLFAGLMGTTLFGVIAVPILLALRGVLLSYATSALVCLYGGWHGSFLSMSIFGVPGLCSVVSLFIIGWNVLCYRYEDRLIESKGKYSRRKQLITGIFTIFIWIFLGTVVQHWICPVLLNRLTFFL